MTDVVRAGTATREETLQVQIEKPLLLSLWLFVVRKDVTCTFPCLYPDDREMSRRQKCMKVAGCRWEIQGQRQGRGQARCQGERQRQRQGCTEQSC